MVEEYRKRRDLVMSLLADIPGIKPNHPEGAFYVFPDVSYYFGKSYNPSTGSLAEVIRNSDDLCMYWLNEYHVAIVTGSAFGDSNCVRISYATSVEKLKEAMRRVKEALSKLR
jgi:aspartate aminotransferase